MFPPRLASLLCCNKFSFLPISLLSETAAPILGDKTLYTSSGIFFIRELLPEQHGSTQFRNSTCSSIEFKLLVRSRASIKLKPNSENLQLVWIFGKEQQPDATGQVLSSHHSCSQKKPNQVIMLSISGLQDQYNLSTSKCTLVKRKGCPNSVKHLTC